MTQTISRTPSPIEFPFWQDLSQIEGSLSDLLHRLAVTNQNGHLSRANLSNLLESLGIVKEEKLLEIIGLERLRALRLLSVEPQNLSHRTIDEVRTELELLFKANQNHPSPVNEMGKTAYSVISSSYFLMYILMNSNRLDFFKFLNDCGTNAIPGKPRRSLLEQLDDLGITEIKW